jgi:hypothetical protein
MENAMYVGIGKVLVCALALGVLPGCVEMSKTITLNPDGSGKVSFETVAAPNPLGSVVIGPQPKPKPTLDDKKRKELSTLLTKSKGVTAWKNVSIQWAADGRLRIKGTAYFQHVEDLKLMEMGEAYLWTKGKDGNYRLEVNQFENKDGPPRDPPPDLAKMTDAELDQYILEQRVAYQETKWLLTALFTDLKIKSVVRLPGPALNAKGFTKDNARMVSLTIDGDAILVAVKKVMALDNATLKRKMRELKKVDIVNLSFFPNLVLEQPVLVVDKAAEPQFDYAREVKDAIAAYPALRKQLDLEPGVVLPGEAGKKEGEK